MRIFYYNGTIKYLEYKTKQKANSGSQPDTPGLKLIEKYRIAAYNHGVGVPLSMSLRLPAHGCGEGEAETGSCLPVWSMGFLDLQVQLGRKICIRAEFTLVGCHWFPTSHSISSYSNVLIMNLMRYILPLSQVES